MVGISPRGSRMRLNLGHRPRRPALPARETGGDGAWVLDLTGLVCAESKVRRLSYLTIVPKVCRDETERQIPAKPDLV